MVSKVLLLIIFMFSFACTTSFRQERNCSAKALAFMESDFKVNEKLIEQNKKNGIEWMAKLTPEIKKCYYSTMDAGAREEYHACAVIGVDEKSKIKFLDVDDKSKNFNSELKTCITKLIESADLKYIQSTIIVQPINLYP